MDAFGIAAPVASNTVPEMAPCVMDWVRATPAVSAVANSSAIQRVRFLMVIEVS
jgi:hypothetical protein